MSFIYKNPLTSSQLDSSSSVTRDKVFGTNFSVLQIGGYMEVYTLADLDFTIPEGDTGLIEFTGNTIPINYSKRALSFLPDTINLNSDNISTGRRRLGMLVYVHETNLTYQYTITNYENLWNAASGSTTESDYGTTITTSTTGGTAFIDAWLDSSIEGVSGVTRSNARWRIFYGTDITVTGGTYNSGTGTLTMTNTTGGTFNVTGFTTGGGSDTYVTGGTFSSDTLTLDRNDGNNVNVTGFTSINTNIANSNLTLDQSRTVSLNANDLKFIGGSAETLQFTSSDLILSAATGGGTISFKGISSSSENRVLVINTNGVLSYNDNIQGDTAISALTYNSEWGVTKELTDGTSGTTQLPFITGGTFDGSNINLNIAGGLEPTISISGPESSDIYVTGGTYNNTTGTLTLERNDTNTFNITGFTTGSTSSLTLQDVTDNGSSTTNGITVDSLTSTRDITINEGITAGNGGGDISTNTVFGANALDSNITGVGNTAFGNRALSATTGNRNSAFGSSALYNNTSGNDNTAIGMSAMYNSTTSSSNVAVGREAFYNGGGGFGVAIGYQAGYEATSGSRSVLIGYRAGYDITSNGSNIAIGYESLRFNDAGSSNVAIGDTALQGNRSGNFNVGVGNDALVSNTTGLRNVGVGSDSLSNNQTGNDNVALGFEAGQNIDGGGLNGTANDSIFIGKGSKASVNNGSNEIVIGTDAIGNGSNTITLGNTAHTDTYLFGTVHGVPYLTGGTYSNGTLTLEDVDGGSFNITGFTTGSTGSQNIQQVLDNGNVSTTGMYISGATLTATTVDINGGYIDGVVLGNTAPVTITSNNATITGGYLNGVVLGNTTPVTITSNNATITGGYLNGVVLGNTTPVTITSNNATITGGNINGTNIGLTTRGSAGFTYIFDNNGSTGTTGQVLSTTTTGITWIDSSSTDYYVTGGTYDNSTGTLTLSRNDANTFNITGFTTGTTEDTYVTGTSYNQLNKTLTIGLNDGVEFTATGFSPTITGGTYSSGEISLENNDGTSTTIGGLEILTHIGTTTASTVSVSGTTIDTVNATTYQGAFFDYVINDGTNYRAGTVQSVWDGTSISHNDFSTVDIGDTVNFTWTMELSGGNALLKANIAGGTWNIRIIKHLI